MSYIKGLPAVKCDGCIGILTLTMFAASNEIPVELRKNVASFSIPMNATQE